MESDLEQQLRLVEQELHQVQGRHAISNLEELTTMCCSDFSKRKKHISQRFYKATRVWWSEDFHRGLWEGGFNAELHISEFCNQQ